MPGYHKICKSDRLLRKNVSVVHLANVDLNETTLTKSNGSHTYWTFKIKQKMRVPVIKRMPKRRPPADRIQKLRLGTRKVETVGVPRSFWADFYHLSMTTSWPMFFAAFAGITLASNLVFALLFMLDPGGVANVPPDKPWWAFYFSMETLATVGYGDMHPASEYTHIIASLVMVVGILLSAVITGLIFARFSRPRARFLFSDVMVIGMHDGQKCLMMRVANARHNTVSNAKAKLWCLMAGVTAEGQTYRRFTELKLLRDENPTFILSWTIFHVIDETSPIFGMDSEDLDAADVSFTLSITGVDETVAQTVQARKNYQNRAIHWNHQFADILAPSDNDAMLVDFRKFHDVVGEDA